MGIESDQNGVFSKKLDDNTDKTNDTKKDDNIVSNIETSAKILGNGTFAYVENIDENIVVKIRHSKLLKQDDIKCIREKLEYFDIAFNKYAKYTAYENFVNVQKLYDSKKQNHERKDDIIYFMRKLIPLNQENIKIGVFQVICDFFSKYAKNGEKNRFIHGDLKLDNILVNNDYSRAYLGDLDGIFMYNEDTLNKLTLSSCNINMSKNICHPIYIWFVLQKGTFDTRNINSQINFFDKIKEDDADSAFYKYRDLVVKTMIDNLKKSDDIESRRMILWHLKYVDLYSLSMSCILTGIANRNCDFIDLGNNYISECAGISGKFDVSGLKSSCVSGGCTSKIRCFGKIRFVCGKIVNIKKNK